MNKLIKGRPMDNLEFLQWLRGFFEVCVRQTEREGASERESEKDRERENVCGGKRGGKRESERECVFVWCVCVTCVCAFVFVTCMCVCPGCVPDAFQIHAMHAYKCTIITRSIARTLPQDHRQAGVEYDAAARRRVCVCVCVCVRARARARMSLSACLDSR
jgi:hypothetical protein